MSLARAVSSRLASTSSGVALYPGLHRKATSRPAVMQQGIFSTAKLQLQQPALAKACACDVVGRGDFVKSQWGCLYTIS